MNGCCRGVAPAARYCGCAPRNRVLLLAARWGGALLLASLLGIATAQAEQTRFFDLEGFGAWLEGNPETTAISDDGSVVIAPTVTDLLVDAAAAYSAAAAHKGKVYVARVDDGQVLLIDGPGKVRELFKVDEAAVTAMLATDAGLFVAAATPAKIYKVDGQGKGKRFYVPDAAYVWAMAAGADGSIYCVTGEPARALRIDKNGNAKVLFEPEQEHLRSVAWDKSLGLFVGGGEHGILYRAPSRDEKAFFALHDTTHQEITSILVARGRAYIAAVTGADSLAEADGEGGAPGGKGKKSKVSSQFVEVSMDGTAEVLAGSDDEAVFSLAVDAGGRILVATGASGNEDPRGRIYSVDPAKRDIAMIYQAPSRRLTHLVADNGAVVAVGSAGGRVFSLSKNLAKKGEFLTKPFDAGVNSRFGVVELFGRWEKGTAVTVAARGGYTATPDATWTPWSKELRAPAKERPLSENGRYVQLRLTLSGDGSRSPEVNRVRLAFLRQNLRPYVREVVALRKGIELLPIVQEESKNKTINLAEKASKTSRQATSEEPSTPPARARQVETDGALTVKWLAEDPNGDALRYDLMVRSASAGNGDWRMLEEELESPFYTLRSSQLPDGHYQFRVRATDAPSNPDGVGKEDTRESRSVLIDNTAPRFDPLQLSFRGRQATVRGVVADEVGPLIEASYSIDGAQLRPLAPDDGVLDGPGEAFTIQLGELKPGSHSITVRVVDEGENVGFAEKRFDVR